MRPWNTFPFRLGFISFCFFFFGAVTFAYAQATISLPHGQVGAAYSTEIKTEGGLAPLSWQVAGGALPNGLRISSTGKIEGTPSEANRDPFSFVLSVSDSSQPPQTAVIRFSVVILAAPLRIVGVTAEQTPFRIVGVSGVSASAGDFSPAANDPGPASVPQRSGLVPPALNPSNNSGSVGTPQPTKAPNDNGQASKANQNSCSSTQTTGGICGGPMLRTIVGFEQAGVSAAQSQQDFFFDLLYDRPLAFQIDPDLGPALRSWGNLRVSSVPQQITTDVATFAASFAQQVGQLKVNQVAQAFEFLGGIEYRFWPPREIYASTDPQNDAKTHTRVSASFVLGGGVITPLSPKDSVQIFSVPSNQPNFFTQFPQAMGKQFVAFTLPDRNRFFRQAYGGFRVKTHFLGDSSRTRFPEVFDLTYGFNEAITGGRIRGGVMRLEGFVPIPYGPASWIYLFGTGMFKPGARATISNPFLLAAAPTGTLPTDPNAVVISTSQADRDYYRVGFGIDFMNLIANWTCNFSSDAAAKAKCAKK